MATTFQNDLGNLTGEEIYHLLMQLAKWQMQVIAAMVNEYARGKPEILLIGMNVELHDLMEDAAMQIARITVPLRQAQAIVYRQAFARSRPVPMTSDTPGQAGQT